MSHFTVAVFTEPNGKSVEDLLAPFHEFECTGEVDEYVQSIDMLEEAKEEYKIYTFTKLISPDGKYHDPYSDEFYREPTEEEKKSIGIGGSGFGNGISYNSKDWGDGKGYRPKVKYIPEGYKEVEVNATDMMSLRDFIEYYHEKNVILENEKPDIYDKHKWGWMRLNNKGEVIELIRRTNPNSEWDWYQIGGRWCGALKLKPGATSGEYGEKSWCNATEVIPENMVDSAKVKDIDFSMDEKIYKDKLRFWELKIEGQEPQNEKDKKLIEWDIYKNEYYTERYNNKEEFARLSAEFSSYAVITPDGVWHSKGDMGWWGCSSETAEEAKEWNKSFYDTFIKTADPEWSLTVVDCHI